MFKKLILSLLFTSLTVLGTACTSDGTDESANADSEAAAGAEGGEETAASEDGDGGGEEETASTDEDSDEEKAEDTASEDDLGEEIAGNTDEKEEEVGDLDDEDLGEEVAKTEPVEDKKEETPPPKMDEPPSDVAMSDPAPAPVVEAAPPAGNIPLQKVKTEPFKKAGILANTVYLGRPEDTVQSISRRIYGSDKSADLIAVNGFLKRGVKAGDKIYYNSPKRPTDETQMMTYFEDIGAAPQEYEAKEGENIRKISKKLLGFEDAWKEVWSTNAMVESKDALPEGTKLRYWTSDAVAAAPTPPPQPEEVAANTPPPPADIPPPPADIPPPPPGAGTTASSNEMSPTPPPTPEPIVEAPPPPPPVAMEPKTKPQSNSGGEFSMAGLMENKDTMTIVIGGAVVVIGLLVILAMARKRRTRIDFGQTQV
ncbi:MAG: hypothetical protein A4S09_14705 [Proteobacteria bacterium SG_bin7]|nr:MAG: hypothetical protein A4S09_14705 [Proteobacteria bacterium SG_bin7]